MKLTIEMRARPEKARELDQTLHALLPAIRSAKGCRSCRLCRDLEDAEVFLLEIDWDARDSLENFIPSPRGGALLGAVDLLSDAPRVKIGGNEKWMGMDALRKMRKKEK
jgi:quinol monooxygenase YgiN